MKDENDLGAQSATEDVSAGSIASDAAPHAERITARAWQISNASGRLPNIRRVRMPSGEADTFRAHIQTVDIRTPVVTLDFGYGTKGSDQDEQIAQLIAAAPELLESLKRITDWVCCLEQSAAMREPIEEARAAIAKAEGKV